MNEVDRSAAEIHDTERELPAFPRSLKSEDLGRTTPESGWHADGGCPADVRATDARRGTFGNPGDERPRTRGDEPIPSSQAEPHLCRKDRS